MYRTRDIQPRIARSSGGALIGSIIVICVDLHRKLTRGRCGLTERAGIPYGIG
jgi:hypothetical protein